MEKIPSERIRGTPEWNAKMDAAGKRHDHWMKINRFSGVDAYAKNEDLVGEHEGVKPQDIQELSGNRRGELFDKLADVAADANAETVAALEAWCTKTFSADPLKGVELFDNIKAQFLSDGVDLEQERFQMAA